MTDPLALVDPAWQHLGFDHEQVLPGESLPDLAGLTVACDLETKPVAPIAKAGLSAHHGEVLGIAVGCPERQRAWYLPLRHRAPGSAQFNLAPEPAFRWLEYTLANARLVLNQNWKLDAKFCAVDGKISPETYRGVPLYDTLVGNVLIDEREAAGLKPSCARVLNLPADEEAAIKPYLKGDEDHRDYSFVPADLMASYACGDVERALRLAGWQRSRLASEGVDDLFRLEMDVMRDLIDAELEGARVDVEAIRRDLPETLTQELFVAQRIAALCGASLNPNSQDDLVELVTGRLGLPILVTKMAKDRQKRDVEVPVFDDAVLQLYGRTYPEYAELFFRCRQARRLEHVRGFLQSYFELQVGGRVHTNIKQVEARTGRESSELPNLQQIAKEQEWPYPPGMERLARVDNDCPFWIARGCEQYFLADPDSVILSFDYSQIEYRFFAHYLNFAPLLEGYRTNAALDMHDWVAKEILAGKIERDDAKSANFGIVFNMGKRKLVKYMATQGVGISEQEAGEALRTYYAKVPLEQLQQDVGRALVQNGYVKTILGRKRRLSKFGVRRWGEAKRSKTEDRGMQPYQALNAICQGGGVDLLKHRSVAANRVARSFGGRMFLKVHDDCKFRVPKDAALECARAIRPVLERFERPDGTPYLKLPIYTKCMKTETSWYDAAKFELGEAA